MNRTILISLAVVALVAILWYGLNLSSETGELEYRLEAVTRGDVESVVVTTGTLEALNTVVVGSQLSGPAVPDSPRRLRL